MAEKIITIDFETKKIMPRPDYPPRPVGVSIKEGSKPSVYYAWGHPTENNCDFAKACRILQDLWKSALAGKWRLLFHNAKFDIDVAETFCGCPRLPWDCYHDTLFLLFLDDPHAESLSLKPSAARLLGMPPEEQDAVMDWLLANFTIDGKKPGVGPNGQYYWAAYISEAPGGLVGKYARGDVDRTYKLFQLLWKSIVARGMKEPYDRERRLLPHLIDNERQGARVDTSKLEADIGAYEVALKKLEDGFLKKKLGDINFDSDAELAKAMLEKGLLAEDRLLLTPGGKYSMNKESVGRAVVDPAWSGLLAYRAQLNTCLRTFMKNWHGMAVRSNGLIFTSWNQVRATADGGTVGARTGRLSSSPNFQNIPKPMEAELKKLKKLCGIFLPQLPAVRSYIVPYQKGWVLIDRDYSQQELRILAHFEDGILSKAYADDPWLDMHEYVRTLLEEQYGKDYGRGPVKTTNFGLIYGMGYDLLAAKAGVDKETAKDIKQSILRLFPGLGAMNRDMKARAVEDRPIRTWGGREYYCEPPKMMKNKRTGKMEMRTFDYKLINVLVQGSAGDCTKEAWIRMADGKPKDMPLYFTVHDEFMASCPKGKMKKYMEYMREKMESVEFDVPMLSDGKWSPENWAACKTYDKKGKVLK